jgi:arginase
MNVNRRSQEIQQRQEHGIPTLLGIPFDGQSSYLRGAAEAPGKIREALACEASNHWTETGVDLGGKGVYEDSGDLELLGTDAFAAIEKAIGELIGNGRRPVSLGEIIRLLIRL